MTDTSAPIRVTLHTGDFGSGPCFLLRLHYGASDTRNVLVDLGGAQPVDAAQALLRTSKRHHHVRGVDVSSLDGALPGVRVHVLAGRAVARDPDQRVGVGKFQAGAPASTDDEPFPGAAVLDRDLAPAHTRWFCRRVDDASLGHMLDVARALDRAIEPARAILLFEIGAARLLFFGDAQIEAWSAALAHQGAREMLAGFDPAVLAHGNSFAYVGRGGERGSLRAAPRARAGSAAIGSFEEGQEIDIPI